MTIVAAIILAAGIGVVTVRVTHAAPSLPSSEAKEFLRDWARFDGAAAGRLTSNPAAAAAAIGAMRDTLGIDRADLRAGRARRRPGGAEVSYAANLDVAGLGPWTYRGVMQFVRRRGTWVLAWSPATLHPGLGPDQHF